jgi:hypothetical protein
MNKLIRTTIAISLAGGFLALANGQANAATVGDGKPCTTIGKVSTVSSGTFVCTALGSKKLWKKFGTADVTFTMPNLRGQILQTAQDKLQGLGSFLLFQKDASGMGRMQLFDRQWRVCRQDPQTGVKTSITDFVTLWSVKLSESC